MENNYRMTLQTNLVLSIAKKLGHSTNSQILTEAKKSIPELTATTVHRITKRLIDRGLLSYGPEIKGSALIDANISVHDHFLCAGCNGIKDFNITDDLRLQLSKQAGIDNPPVSLTIFGDCKRCFK